jgi:hypothetical protein
MFFPRKWLDLNASGDLASTEIGTSLFQQAGSVNEESSRMDGWAVSTQFQQPWAEAKAPVTVKFKERS